jgi:hypothetical protein
MKQELLTLPEHLSSPPVFSGVRVTRSLVVYVCFVDRCLSFCPFSFGHCTCVVYSSSIYRFWLPPWYLHTLFHTLPENLSSHLVFNEISCFQYNVLETFICLFSLFFDHYIVPPSSTYDFCLNRWYL